MEPPDTPDEALDTNTVVSCSNPIAPHALDGGLDSEDIRHPSTVPAAGRGNSDDGTEWINPSANQLYNACKRKNKKMEEKDKDAVAMIHGEVIEKTWDAVMQYENLHRLKCECPKLSSFEGMYGKPSLKAQLLHRLGYPLPWDRHDWVVDRCGTSVKYIIDYHHGFNAKQPYVIDCRPDLWRFSNIMDRLTIQFRAFKYKHLHTKTSEMDADKPSAGNKSNPQFLTDLFESNDACEKNGMRTDQKLN